MSAIVEARHAADRQRMPSFVIGQRFGHDDGDAVVGRGDFAEIDSHVFVHQMGNRERRLADDVVQFRRAVGKQAIAVGEQKIEGTEAPRLCREFVDGCMQRLFWRHAVGKTLAQVLQQPTKSQFTVSLTDRQKATIECGLVIHQIAVVRKNPVTPPEFAAKRVCIFQANAALCRLSDMRDDVE